MEKGKDFIMIESDAFRAIMHKLDRIDGYVQAMQKEQENQSRKRKKLLTSEEAAGILRVSKQTLWRMRDRGDIRYIKHGSVCLYTEEEIENILETYTFRRPSRR